jgi:hypothetical protein
MTLVLGQCGDGWAAGGDIGRRSVGLNDPELMRRPPSAPTERLLTKERFMLMFSQGTFLPLTATYLGVSVAP